MSNSMLADYYYKKNLVSQLEDEIRDLEASEEFQKDMQFGDALQDLIKKNGKTPRDVAQIVYTLDPTLAPAASKPTGPSTQPRTRAKRPMLRYKNPHTGEVVETRGGNHATLNEWRKQYGAATVANWKH